MGQARRKATELLLPYAVSGQLQAVTGSKLEGETPDVIAMFAAGELNLSEIMDELRSGRIVQVSGVRRTTIKSVEDWLESKVGLGAELLGELRRAHDDPNRGSQIYPMSFEDKMAIEVDRAFFAANPDRYLRVRPLIGYERRIGELNPGWTDRVLSIMVDRTNGIVSRFFFGCHEESEDTRQDLDDLQIAGLALRYAMARTVPSLEA